MQACALLLLLVLSLPAPMRALRAPCRARPPAQLRSAASSAPGQQASQALAVDPRPDVLHPAYRHLLLHPLFSSSPLLAAQVSPSCSLGYSSSPPSPKTLLAYTRAAKASLSLPHPPSPAPSEQTLPPLLLVKVGEFYESYGVDSLLLVHLAGLNPMGGKLRAGMPLANLQAAAASVFKRWREHGLPFSPSIAVYEEDGPPAPAGSPFSALKPRHLTQVLTQDDQEYTYNNVLSEASRAPAAYPTHGKVRPVLRRDRSGGWTYACVYPTVGEYRRVPGLTDEAVRSYLRLDGASKVSFVPRDKGDYPPVLYGQNASSPPFEVARFPLLSSSNLPTVVAAVLSHHRSPSDPPDPPFASLSLLPPPSSRPLHRETLSQLGVVKSPAVPPLLDAIVTSRSFQVRGLVERWLTTPPPTRGRIRSALEKVSRPGGVDVRPVSVDAVRAVSLLRRRQCNAAVFRDVRALLCAAGEILASDIGGDVMAVMRHETGTTLAAGEIRENATAIAQVIGGVIAEEGAPPELPPPADPGAVPDTFFARNESPWAGRVRRTGGEVEAAFDGAAEAKARLVEAAREGFGGEVVYDVFNNLVVSKKKPEDADSSSSSSLYHPKDRFNKVMKTRWTNKRLDDAVAEYVAACEECERAVSDVLKSLAATITDMPRSLETIRCAGYVNHISVFALDHARLSISRGWYLASCEEGGGGEGGGLKGVWPYWMSKDVGAGNDVDLESMVLLTAPNMSGKSTLMRSTAAAALLTMCGMFSPTKQGSVIRPYNTVFFRGASSDVPSEDKSAFGKECEDVREMFLTCDENSLVFIDELGRGTSPIDGTALAAAVLEGMQARRMSGFFATHLHNVLDLDLRGGEGISRKRMGMRVGAGDEVDWTYRLEDGVCKDSLALVTARRFGLPEEIIERAAEFADTLGEGGVGGLGEGGTLKIHSNRTPSQWLEQISGKEAVSIQPGREPPPYLSGKSCAYVMEMGTEGGGSTMVYVGETDNLHGRIQKHRARSDFGLDWEGARISVVAVPEGKSEARRFESVLIQKLSGLGVSLVSDRDGLNRHFGNFKEE